MTFFVFEANAVLQCNAAIVNDIPSGTQAGRGLKIERSSKSNATVLADGYGEVKVWDQVRSGRNEATAIRRRHVFEPSPDHHPWALALRPRRAQCGVPANRRFPRRTPYSLAAQYNANIW